MFRHSMLRSMPLLIGIIVTMLLGTLIPVGHAATIQATLIASPSSLPVSLTLGSTTDISVQLTNTASTSVTPALYEAYPAATPNATFAQAPISAGPRAVTLPHQTERIDPQLPDVLSRTPTGRGDFIVYLRDQADLSAAYTISDWGGRGQYVYRTLVAWADTHQRDIRNQLTARRLSYRPFWIVNALLVQGTLDDARLLAQRADVAMIGINHSAALPPPTANINGTNEQCNPSQPTDPVCWNIRKLGVDRVWRDFGITGKGIVIASLDTGVDSTHPALATQYRGYVGPGVVNHDYNWFDPQGILAEPTDDSGHGTHTMGTMVGTGDGTTDHPAIGMAPGARWITAQGCDSFFCTEDDLISSAQWMLAPTNHNGTQPRPDLRPMIINNSWAGLGGNTWFSGYTAAWRAAGIFPVFAAGNAGSESQQTCGSIASPGDYADVLAVGATDANDTIAPFSLLGPAAGRRLKPDFVAPGTYQYNVKGVYSSLPNGGYAGTQGTSMAAPHVSGVIALLWSANPALIGDYNATYAKLKDSAHQLSDTRCGDPLNAPNNVYGYGRIDAYAAVTQARVDIPWMSAPTTLAPLSANGTTTFNVHLDARRVPSPGTYLARLQIYGGDLSQEPTTITITLTVTPAAQQATISGRVISGIDGAPVHASIGIQNGQSITTDANGAYTLTLAQGNYTLTTQALSYLPDTRAIALTGNLLLPDIVLQPDIPHLTINSTPISRTIAFNAQESITIPLQNTGTRPLNYLVEIPPDQFGVWSSEEAGGPTYQWINLPPNAPTLTLGDIQYQDKIPIGFSFPFYSNSFTETLVASDGTIGFSPPFQYFGIDSNCLPANELYFLILAPFRANLDPSRGGTVRYGTLPGNQTFVVSYENVPLHTGPISATYTFQAILHSDGRIGFQYKKLAALPNQVSVGIQRAYGQYQQVGCGISTPVHDGLALEFFPQPETLDWMKTMTRITYTLPSGAQDSLTVTLNWMRPATARPYRGRIQITSSDPFHQHTSIPIELIPQRSPREHWIPLLWKELSLPFTH